MNYIKFLLAAICIPFAMVSCDTDDLRSDLDNLTNRVEALEAQNSLMNDNINAIKILMEGGKTIKDIEEETIDGNTVYTLTLSDNQTIRLSQGGEGKIVYPELGVNEEGQWTVNGEVLKQNGEPVQAVGKDGDDGVTPKFRIESETNYWQVSYDGGGTYEYVTDESGNKVCAVAGEGSAAGDTFFESIKVEGDYLIFALKADNDPKPEYKIPIVENLTCEIVAPTDGYDEATNTWSIGYGEIAETDVTVQGDNIVISAPYGWKAQISEENKLIITAPDLISESTVGLASRATADNQTDVVLQVNSGINWAMDKIRVKVVANSYYDLYDKTGELEICGRSIDKATYGDATIISDDSETKTINASGVYFIKTTQEVTLSAGISVDKLIIVGDTPDVRAKVVYDNPNGKTVTLNKNDNPQILALRNVDLDLDTKNTSKQTAFTLGGNDFTNILFDGCLMRMTKALLFYASQTNKKIESVEFYDCFWDFKALSGNDYKEIMGTYNGTVTLNNVRFENNVFYSSDNILKKIRLINSNKATFENIELKHNSFINTVNYANNTGGYICANKINNVTISDNLISTNASITVFSPITPNDGPEPSMPSQENVKNNYAYCNNWWTWGLDSYSWLNTEGITYKNTEDPFKDGTIDYEELIFIPAEEYAQYGAQMK